MKSKRLENAFLKINREDFVPESFKKNAFENRPLPIGFKQTISQPAVVAFMLEKLSIRKGDKVLDIGSGSGWTTALLAELVGEKGKVIGLEKLEKLKKFGENNVAKYNFLKKGRVRIFQGDGYEGFEKEAPYDKILVSAALKSREEVPACWYEQLRMGGIIMVPIKNSIYKLVKREKGFEENKYFGFTFVPLVKG